MNQQHEQAREEAIGWAMRVADPDFGEWTALTRWLEADPLHAAAFEEALAAGDAADAALKAAPVPSALPVVSRPARRRIAGGLLAAAIIGAIGWTAFEHQAAPYTVATRPGETRTLRLEGATIALNGNSRITLDRHDPRRATLESGEALFDVRHDPDHPFRLTVGDAKLEDVGTRFDVTQDGRGLRVAVAEGAVLYNPDREAVRITAGAVLRERPGENQVMLGQIDPAGVGGWREGRLAFQSAPLATVAADLTRSLGVTIRAAPEVAARPFTGVIATHGDRVRLIADLGPLLDVKVREDHGSVLLTAKAMQPRS